MNPSTGIGRTRDGYPSWIDILGVVTIFFLTGLAAGAIVPLITPGTGGLGIFLSYVIQAGLTITYALWLKKRRTGTYRGVLRFSVRGTDPSVVLWAVIVMLSVNIIIEPLINLFPDRYLDLLASVLGSGGWAMLTSLAAAPILEEVLFRGILQEGLTRKYGGWRGVVVASAIFGAVHIIPQQVVAGFLIGIVLGYVYLRTHSLLAVMVVHGVNNAFAQLALIFTGDITLTTREIIGSDKVYAIIYSAAVFIILCSAGRIVYLTFKKRLDPFSNSGLRRLIKKEKQEGQ